MAEKEENIKDKSMLKAIKDSLRLSRFFQTPRTEIEIEEDLKSL